MARRFTNEVLFLPRLEAAFAARRARVEALIARTSGVPTQDALHDLRVALRRTASLARLSRDVPKKGDGEALRLAARRLRRDLSEQRTQEVSKKILLARFQDDPRRRVLARQAAAAIGASEPVSADAAELRALRRTFAARDASLAISDPRGAVERRLRKRIEARLARKKKRLLKFGRSLSVEELHPARIKSKDFRYSLEFVKDVAPEVAEVLELLVRLQDRAGDAHDYFELVSEVKRQVEKGASRRRALLPPLEDEANKALRRVRDAWSRLRSALEKFNFRFGGSKASS